MKQTGSNFVTLAGMAALALLTLVAAYFGFTTLEAFLIGLLLLCIVAFLWCKFSLNKIELDIDSEDCRAFPGQILETGARLKNSKLLPLIRLDLSFPVEEGGCAAPLENAEEGEEPSISAAFLWVMPHQTIEWTQKALASSRGVCRIDSLKLSSGDGFGLSVKEKVSPLKSSFRYVVYPALLEVDISQILNQLSEMEAAKNGFYTDKTLLLGTREYCEGDSFKDINWRMLAKTDEMQVNIHEQLAMRRVCFVPDMQSFTYQGEIEVGHEKQTATLLRKEEFERMLSLTASMINALNDREVICSLVIPSYGETETRIEIPESRDFQVMQLLTALAEINYQNENTVFPAEELISLQHRLGQIYILSMAPDCTAEKQFPGILDEAGAIRIVCGARENSYDDRRIIKETELTAI